MMDKTFDPAAVEARISAALGGGRAFRAGRPDRPDAEPYCIVIPPPNVTGSLHMGHALNNTLQDILCRFERMRGKDVLWQPGTDHAGIATQMVVERQLMERQQPTGARWAARRSWSRSGRGRQSPAAPSSASSSASAPPATGRASASPWTRACRAPCSKVFVDLHEQGLIYKDKRLVNWDPKFQTAISDLEVQQVEVKGHLWHFGYPLDGRARTSFITVATTRPETMLGDTAVAVHPEDERYRDLVGSKRVLPLVGRLIPIVADEYSDPEKGTGAVKITPAHDFNDFEVGRRHGLPQINILDPEARYARATTPSSSMSAESAIRSRHGADGLDRFEARKRIVAMLEERGLLEKIEPHAHTVPHGDRSGVVIEPYLTDQWYVDVKPLAERAIEAVRDGRDPLRAGELGEDLLPVAREHPALVRLAPALVGPPDPGLVRRRTATMFVETEEEAARRARPQRDETPRHGRRTVGCLTRDPDVLDTWFSSALWPFSTLGWPDETPELTRYYPTTSWSPASTSSSSGSPG